MIEQARVAFLCKCSHFFIFFVWCLTQLTISERKVLDLQLHFSVSTPALLEVE